MICSVSWKINELKNCETAELWESQWKGKEVNGMYRVYRVKTEIFLEWIVSKMINIFIKIDIKTEKLLEIKFPPFEKNCGQAGSRQ